MESEGEDSAPVSPEPGPRRDPSAAPRDDVSRPDPRIDPSDSLKHHIEELAEAIRIYIHSQIDLAKVSIRRVVVLTGIFLVAVLGAASVFMTAVVLLCLGVSDVISELLGHRWAGELATGIIVVGGGAIAAFITIRIWDKQAHRRTVEKYAEMGRTKNGNGKH